jgi:myosin-5
VRSDRPRSRRQVFAVNGFEQLLINYANDKLQYFFTQTAIGVVAKLYESEGIPLDLRDEERLLPTLHMLEGGPKSKICLARASRPHPLS